MKDKIHPKYEDVKFQCACGNVIESRSTKKGVVKVDICSSCHPFFTGKEKLVDSAGRVEKFMRKYKDHYEEGGKDGKPALKKAAKKGA